MIRRLWVPVGLAVLVAASVVSPAIRPGLARAGAASTVVGLGGTTDTLALHFRGTGRGELAGSGRFQFTTDLYSLVTGQKVGSATNNTDMRAPVMDHVMTFHLPDGELVAHSQETVMPDPAHPGYAVIGIHPEANNIVAEKGTEAYAGRTGKVTMSGWHDGSRLPEQATFNDFYLIQLDPKP